MGVVFGTLAQYELSATTDIPVTTRYTAVLTGAPNSLSDYSFTLNSFQAGLTNGAASYCSAVTSYTAAALTAFVARPDGELVVYQTPVFSDGVGATQELARFNFDDLQYYVGSRSSSISLKGSKQITNTAPTTITLTADKVMSLSLGSEQNYNFDLAPTGVWPRAGDVVVYGGVSYNVVRVDYSLSARDQNLTIVTTKV